MRRPVITTVLLLSVAACGTLKERGSDAADSTVRGPIRKLRVSMQEYLSQAPIMIADAEGFFREEGIELEFLPGMRSQESMVALVTGDIDVRPAPISAAFLSAIAQKAPIRAVADEGYFPAGGCAYFGIVLRKGLDTAGSPRIQRMRTGTDGATRFISERLLTMRNIPIREIEAVNMPEGAMASSLEAGGIDAISATEPMLTRLTKIGRRWLSAQDAAPDMQFGVIAFSSRLLNEDRELGVRFLRAYRRGIARFGEGKTPRNVAILAKRTHESEDIIREACWPSFRENSRIKWEGVETFQAWALANKLIEQTVTQSQVWDSSFLVASDRASRK